MVGVSARCCGCFHCQPCVSMLTGVGGALWCNQVGFSMELLTVGGFWLLVSRDRLGLVGFSSPWLAAALGMIAS